MCYPRAQIIPNKAHVNVHVYLPNATTIPSVTKLYVYKYFGSFLLSFALHNITESQQ